MDDFVWFCCHWDRWWLTGCLWPQIRRNPAVWAHREAFRESVRAREGSSLQAVGGLWTRSDSFHRAGTELCDPRSMSDFTNLCCRAWCRWHVSLKGLDVV